MTDYETIETFAKKHAAKLTVYEQGEHRFHTPEQLEVLKNGKGEIFYKKQCKQESGRLGDPPVFIWQKR